MTMNFYKLKGNQRKINLIGASKHDGQWADVVGETGKLRLQVAL